MFIGIAGRGGRSCEGGRSVHVRAHVKGLGIC